MIYILVYRFIDAAALHNSTIYLVISKKFYACTLNFIAVEVQIQVKLGFFRIQTSQIY